MTVRQRPRLMAGTSAALAISIAVAAGAPGQLAVQTEAPRPSGPARPSSTPAPVRALPLRLRIPSIGVDAAVEQVGVDSTGSIGVPTQPMNVAWYAPGPAPGEPGDAVIDGHLDWYDTPRAVFSDLGRLRPGDAIEVVSTRDTRRFTVTESRTYPYTAQPAGLFDTTGDPRLSLITCAGAWDSRHGTYAERLIVTARRAGPDQSRQQ